MTVNVIIHVGPPKTATSAIQNWLCANRKFLAEKGFFYPEHSVDENGVSSGNVLDVFDRTEDKKLLISEKKVKHLTQTCEKSGCHTLLLSSEFFFFQIAELLVAFPQARFVAYIRFPLDVIESSYNQAVKRHGETKPLGMPKEPKAYHLNLLKSMLKEHGSESFELRLYSKTMFVGGDIVSDFLSVLDIQASSTKSPVVNTSYSFEALEFKRWLNLFLPNQYQHRVDSFLQSLSQEIQSYSLISPSQYQHYIRWFAEQLDDFFDLYPVGGSETFVNEVLSQEQRAFRKQQLSLDEFSSIAQKLKMFDVGLCNALVESAKGSEAALEKRPDFHAVFIDLYSTQYSFRQSMKEWRHKWGYRFRRIYRRLTAPQINPSNYPAAPVDRLRHVLQFSQAVSDGEVYRELALYCEQNGEIGLAYRLMKQANLLRPNGPVITSKLAEYQEKLNLSDSAEKELK